MREHILDASPSAGRIYPIFSAVNAKIGIADLVFLILIAEPAYPLLSGSLGPPDFELLTSRRGLDYFHIIRRGLSFHGVVLFPSDLN